MTLKDVKYNFLVDVAIDLFLTKSISEVTIKDIAVKAGVGEATVYRTFNNKKNIVSAAAEKLQRLVYEKYFDDKQQKNGFDAIDKFFSSYNEIFLAHPDFFKFVSEFDAFLISEGSLSTDDYALGIDMFKKVFFDAYNNGVKDGSVREIENIEAFYYASTHAMLETCKKLSINMGVVKQDETTDKVAEISEIKNIILYYLAPRKV